MFKVINKEDQREEYYVNDEGLKHGEYKLYDDNCLFITANYINGELNGERISYEPNGDISIKMNFKNGKKNGEYISYIDYPEIDKICNYIDDVLHGPFLQYSYKNILIKDFNYNYGKLHGECKEYNFDGSNRTIINYDNDKINGEYKRYTNGQLDSISCYSDNDLLCSFEINNHRYLVIEDDIVNIISKVFIKIKNQHEEKKKLDIREQQLPPICKVELQIKTRKPKGCSCKKITSKSKNAKECSGCNDYHKNTCFELVCCDCGIHMCKNCQGTDKKCECYGICTNCSNNVNRGAHGWPCNDCNGWYCSNKCKKTSKCKEC